LLDAGLSLIATLVTSADYIVMPWKDGSAPTLGSFGIASVESTSPAVIAIHVTRITA
jgi:hypothetical protein